ncbi:MAG: hypothetical protein OSW77_11610 [Proteobacteria bacterium]|nr:hypothetical protein [Pseudomonadota bacterium]
MAMKRTDLEKNKFLKAANRLRTAATPERFGEAATALPDRREQRRLAPPAALLPSAVKLNGDLFWSLQALAAERGTGLNELVGELLTRALEKP